MTRYFAFFLIASLAPAFGQSACATHLGYRELTFPSGLTASIWYPTLAAESSYTYAFGGTSSVALNAPVANCTKSPLVIFSHGYTGCALQSVFFTEALARNGYIVIAPNHQDAACSQSATPPPPQEPFGHPELWTDATYADRRDDMRYTLDRILSDPEFAPAIDAQHIAAAGHSLGGYTVLGLAGGWSSWYDPRIQAVLVLSPYASPYLQAGRIPSVGLPVMFQGGQLDFGVTPVVARPGGAYDQSNRPKYFMELYTAGHYAWTNATCIGYPTVPACESDSRAQIINRFSLAFLDRYLKGAPGLFLNLNFHPEVADYRHAN